MSISIASVTARIRAEVAAELNLFRIPDGYFLMTFYREGYYFERSILVNRIGDLSMTQWLAQAIDFATAAKEAIAANEALKN